MKSKIHLLVSFTFFVLVIPIISIANNNYGNPGPIIQNNDTVVKLKNPVSVSYINKHLARYSPRLILTPTIERNLREKLKTDPLVQSYYKYLEGEAKQILTEPLLTRKLIGKRLLGTSCKMVKRMGVLSIVYRIGKNPEILERIDAEINAVCNFSDWHPAHFLDVAEMSFAVALATDWVGEALPRETIKLAKTALVEKGILPSYVKNKNGNEMGWIHGNSNWNEVCHGGMIAASLVIADENPELAAKTISRTLDKLHNSLKEYGPDGIYPEGPGYWGYGTTYAVLTSSMLTSAFGTDFGIADYPGFMKSADFLLLATAPSGNFFNFSDCYLKKDFPPLVLLAWFAAKTGDGLYLNKAFFQNPARAGRFAGLGLVWLSRFREKKTSVLPLEWYGEGRNPLVFFRGGKDDPGQFYFAAKGGSASVNHSNMDAGTFILELNGIRWLVEP